MPAPFKFPSADEVRERNSFKLLSAEEIHALDLVNPAVEPSNSFKVPFCLFNLNLAASVREGSLAERDASPKRKKK